MRRLIRFARDGLPSDEPARVGVAVKALEIVATDLRMSAMAGEEHVTFCAHVNGRFVDFSRAE